MPQKSCPLARLLSMSCSPLSSVWALGAPHLPTQCGSPRGCRMAELVWVFDESDSALGTTITSPVHRHLRLLGLWGMVPSPPATGAMAPRAPGGIHSCQGTSPGGAIIGSLGCSMAGLLRDVPQVNRLHARDPLAAHLLHCLAYFQVQADFCVRVMHMPGHLNVGTDDLSRIREAAF